MNNPFKLTNICQHTYLHKKLFFFKCESCDTSISNFVIARTWPKIIMRMRPLKFKNRLEVEVSQHRSATPVKK